METHRRLSVIISIYLFFSCRRWWPSPQRTPLVARFAKLLKGCPRCGSAPLSIALPQSPTKQCMLQSIYLFFTSQAVKKKNLFRVTFLQASGICTRSLFMSQMHFIIWRVCLEIEFCKFIQKTVEMLLNPRLIYFSRKRICHWMWKKSHDEQLGKYYSRDLSLSHHIHQFICRMCVMCTAQ